MKATNQLSCTYMDHSRDFFLQVKNILSYNCIRKRNIIQRNIIDCMELRSAKIRSHIAIRRTSRVYSLCVFRLLQYWHPGRDRMMPTSSRPSSFTVIPPAPNQSSSHVVFKSSLHVVFESSSHVVFESSSHVYSNPRHVLYYNPSVTISTRNPSWRGTDTIFFPSISAASHRPECQIQQSSPAWSFEEWPSPSPQEQSSWQWLLNLLLLSTHCLDQGLEGWGGVMDYLCRWHVLVSVYCAWRIPELMRCTQCSILLHIMDICFLTCICL